MIRIIQNPTRLAILIAVFLLAPGLCVPALADDLQATDVTVESGKTDQSDSESSRVESESALEEEPDPLFDDEFEMEELAGFPDPLEETNRNVLKFNGAFDLVVITPIVKSIWFITPDQGKFALRRFFENLNTPVVFINDILQLEWLDAGATIGAFVVNSTVGLGGLFEPAEKIGLSRHSSDFGQTLAIADVPSGPYLVVPFTGPTTVRGASGTVIDIFLRPSTYVFGLGVFFYYGGEGLVRLEETHQDLQELKRSSVDFYPVLRSAYYQNRIGDVWGRREHRKADWDLIDPPAE